TNNGTITLQGGASFWANLAGSSVPFVNNGTLTIDAGTGTSTIGGAPGNTDKGTINIHSGTLELATSWGGDLAESCTINLNNKTILLLDTYSSLGGTFEFSPGSKILGPGESMMPQPDQETQVVVGNGGDVTLEGQFTVPTILMQGQHLGITIPLTLTT